MNQNKKLSYNQILKVRKSNIYIKWKRKNKIQRRRYIKKLKQNKKNIHLVKNILLYHSYRNNMNKIIERNHPFLKWAGGKFKLIKKIQEFIPSKIFDKYIEPFVGAGSVALNINTKNVIINDKNSDLILVWKTVQTNVDELISECKELFSGQYNNKQSYYRLRKEFNTTATGIRRAALFIYLNRHCFNGLCRYNNMGQFNVPIGKYKIIGLPEDELKNASNIIKDWIIHNKDFRNIIKESCAGDVLYIDPPYVSLTSTPGFNDYSSGGFTEQDQIDLADLSKEASNRGVVVIISNHDTQFTRKLYKEDRGATLHTLKVSRTIASKSKNRKPAAELIAVFNKK